MLAGTLASARATSSSQGEIAVTLELRGVVCDEREVSVPIAPGDIMVAGEDGVVVVPKDRAADVLKRSQEIDQRESKMVPYIKQFRSLQKAIEVFNRI